MCVSHFVPSSSKKLPAYILKNILIHVNVNLSHKLITTKNNFQSKIRFQLLIIRYVHFSLNQDI